MISRIFIFVFLFLAAFVLEAGADTIYLKNGNSVEGLIIKEDNQSVELDVGFGTIIFDRQEIESIYKSSQEETAFLHREWRKQQEETKRQQLKRQQDLLRARRKRRLEAEKRLKLKELEYSQTREHIIVDALLNKKVKARLLLDTGATTVLLSSRIAKELGMETSGTKKETGKARMADGREVEVNYVVLESVNVQGVEAENVPAAVLLEETASDDTALPYDGCLGMSFLNKFNFQIDSENKKLILERLNK